MVVGPEVGLIEELKVGYVRLEVGLSEGLKVGSGIRLEVGVTDKFSLFDMLIDHEISNGNQSV